MNENPIEPSDIIDYWFSEKSKQFWFASTPSIDKEITSRYETVWEKAASGGLSSWGETADGSVALIIILDQFPLNMFRGKAKGFKTESMAVEVALNAIDNGFDEEMDNDDSWDRDSQQHSKKKRQSQGNRGRKRYKTRSSNSKVDDDGFPVMDRTMLIPDEGTRQKDSMPASGWLDTTSLSEEELDEVYEDFLKSVHGVNPQKFSRFLRLMKQGSNSVGNPFDEMNLFSKFSVDGKAIFNKDDFIRGVRRLEEEDGIESSMYQNLLQHVRGTDEQFLTDLK